MSQSEFPAGEVDLDRLADYVAGVLEPAEAEQVAGLIDGDAAWADAYTQLLVADAEVSRLLRVDAREAIEPMPADVIARIDDTLRAERAAAPIGMAGATVTPIDRHRAAGTRSQSHRRRSGSRFAGGVAAGVAASVLAVAGFNLLGSVAQQDTATNGAAPAMAPDAESATKGSGGVQSEPPARATASFVAPGPQGTSVVVTTSGNAYAVDTLDRFAARNPIADGVTIQKSAVDAAGELAGISDRVPAPLERLLAPDALFGCLDQITRIHPGMAVAADFATFLGQPALIVHIQQTTGSLVVAVGPECGLAGAAEKAAVPS